MADVSKTSTNQERSSEEPFEQVVAAVKDYAIFTLDSEGRIQSWNYGAERIKGYKKDEIIGQHFSVFYTEEAKRSNHPQFELEYAREHGSYEEENWRIRKDGVKFWANINITFLGGDKGGFVKVTRDLTERKLHETQLQEARDQALAAERWKSQFVANVSHELRTPLTSLVGLSELLTLDDALSEENQATVAILFQSSKDLLLMVNDLLDFSKLDARKMTVEKVAFRFKDVVEEATGLMEIQVAKKGLAFAAHVADDIPAVIVGDSGKLKQVIINLISNAVKCTESGAIEFNCEKREDYALISITDTGIGIAKESQKRIFEPFLQVQMDDAKLHRGTGLGLTISQEYVKLMGGEIGVISTPGEGSTFWFTLPLDVPSEVR